MEPKTHGMPHCINRNHNHRNAHSSLTRILHHVDRSTICDTHEGMSTERPLAVVFFRTAAGNEPVREWLKNLSREECKTVGTDILTVQYA